MQVARHRIGKVYRRHATIRIAGALPRPRTPGSSGFGQPGRSGDNAAMNEENSGTEQPDEAQPVDATRVESQPGEPQRASPQQQDPRRRLRELLAVPERDRSDAQWDEMIELEIQLAPGNRAQEQRSVAGQRQEPSRRQDSGRRAEHGRRKEPGSGGAPAKPFVKKARRNMDARSKK